MKIIFGSDTVVTQSNIDIFKEGQAEKLVGKEIKQILDGADFRVFNLETALTDGASPIKKCGPNIYAPTACINGYKALGANLLCLANNHILDFGYDGLVSTLETIGKNGISKVGAGFTKEEAEKPFILKKDGISVGIYNCCEHEFSWVEDYGFGCNGFDALDTPDKINALKKDCDYVIVVYHGGKEHYRYPSPYLRKVCRKIVEKGADLVLCQHTHCVGSEEDYAGAKIVFGQGNFIFAKDSDKETWGDGILVCSDISKNGITCEYVPYKKTQIGVCIDKSGEILKEFKKRSEEIKEDGFIEKKFVEMADKTVVPRYVAVMLGKNPTEEEVKKLGMQLFHCAECEVHREGLITGLRKKLGLGKYGEFKK